MARALVFLPEARRDLRWFRTYYGKVFPGGAARGARHFGEAVELLKAGFEMGRPQPDGLREYLISGTPFSLVYRIGEKRIEVLRVFDRRSNRPDNWI